LAAPASDVRHDALVTRLRVMTWNVQNLFRPEDGDGPETLSAFQAKLGSLAAVIDAARPHVLALQEVGPPDALSSLQAILGWEMRHVAVGEPDARGIRVAFLSTRVLHVPTGVRIFPDGLLPVQVGDDPPGPSGPALMNQMGRGALEVTIRAGGSDVTIVNCHLKSKLLSFPGDRFSPRDENERARFAAYALYRRTSEAVTVRSHVTDRLAGAGRGYPFVLAGDMNDEPDAATTQILQGPPGSEIGTAGFDRPDAGDGERLWNLCRVSYLGTLGTVIRIPATLAMSS
jgi:endonuclease/exonuclease/phosphatase family metal-dependent hydrolase